MGGRDALGAQLASPRGRGLGRCGGGAVAAPPRPGCGGGAACARSALGWGGLAHNEWPPRLPLLLRRRPRRPRRRRPRPRRRGARPGPRPGPSCRCGARREPPERGHGAGEGARPRPGSGLVSQGRPEGIRGLVVGWAGRTRGPPPTEKEPGPEPALYPDRQVRRGPALTSGLERPVPGRAVGFEGGGIGPRPSTRPPTSLSAIGGR